MRALRLSALLACLSGFAAGCALPGDFDRPRAFFSGEELVPLAGPVGAFAPGESAAFMPYTDDERELRNLAFTFLAPPVDPDFYAEKLLATPYRSSTARYNRLIEDIHADGLRIDPFQAAARRVAEMDAIRERSLHYVSHAGAPDRAAAHARMAENAMLIEQVRYRFGERAAGYRLALERLVVATPAPSAVEAERSLLRLEDRIVRMPPAVYLAATHAPAYPAVN